MKFVNKNCLLFHGGLLKWLAKFDGRYSRISKSKWICEYVTPFTTSALFYYCSAPSWKLTSTLLSQFLIFPCSMLPLATKDDCSYITRYTITKYCNIESSCSFSSWVCNFVCHTVNFVFLSHLQIPGIHDIKFFLQYSNVCLSMCDPLVDTKH